MTAASSAPTVDASKPDLVDLGAELQRELRLQDWRVTYLYVPDLATASGALVYGLCDRLVDNKTATILIRDPLLSSPLPAGVEQKPVLETMLHELLHLHMAPLAADTPQGIIAEEQAVWPIADALARWRGTPRAASLARAMVVGVSYVLGHKTSHRSARMNRTELAMLKAAMGDGKDPEAAMKGVAAALDAYEASMGEDEPAPESKPEPAAPAKAAEAEPQPPAPAKAAEVETKKDTEAVTAKAAQHVTLAQVDQRASVIALRAVGEHAERAALIASNADKLGPAMAASIATLPLATVKAMVAAANVDHASGKRAAKVAVGPVDRLGGELDAGLTSHDVERINKLMGTETATRSAMSKNPTTHAMEFSHLSRETVAQQITRMAAATGAQRS
jgi:hypothetical protein